MNTFLAAGLALADTLPAMPACASVLSDHELAMPEGTRQYIVARPASDSGARLPTVILLHGHGVTAGWMVGRDSFAGYKSKDWMRLADREQLLLIAPQGMKGSNGKYSWNDCRKDATTNSSADDVGFISALIDKAISEHHADPERIYVFGTSNGGGMAYRVGIELGPRLAAIGVQSSLMPAYSSCASPTHPLSVFLTHGTSDKVAPYAGGKVEHWALNGRGTGHGVDASIAIWRELAQLPETPVTYRFPHLQQADGTSATRFIWGNNPAGLQIELLKIDGGGHTQSSRTETMPWLLRKLVGEMNHDVDTPDEAWAFFKDKRAR